MKELDYDNIYRSLGIDVPALDPSYNPDDYGKRLMAEFQVLKDVTYSANTDTLKSAIDEKNRTVEK